MNTRIPGDKPDIPAAAIRGIATGLFLMSFFTFIWAGISNIGWYHSGYDWVPLIFVVLIIIFVLRGISLFREARSSPSLVSAADLSERKRMAKGFGILFGVEGLAIFLAVLLVQLSGHPTYIFPAIALVVALHFFPMAKLFRRRIDYYIAVWTTAIAVAGFYFTYHHTYPDRVISAIVGTGMAIGTASYGIYMLTPAAMRMDKRTLPH